MFGVLCQLNICCEFSRMLDEGLLLVLMIVYIYLVHHLFQRPKKAIGIMQVKLSYLQHLTPLFQVQPEVIGPPDPVKSIE